MAWRTTFGHRWGKWRERLKRELLRDPHRILLERGPDQHADPLPRAVSADRR